MTDVSDPPARLPPLPPSPLPDDLIAECRAGFVANAVRTARAILEVHPTHLRVRAPAVRAVSTYARRMDVDDLVLAFDQIRSIRPVGSMTVIVELPHRAAIALAGPSVLSALRHVDRALTIEPRRFRPFFVWFWLVNHRPGRVHDARRLP
jgi:hypothetical protein